MIVIVGFVSQKGGVGKSTLVRGLAVAAAHAGIKVRIADLDPQQETVAEWEQRRAAAGISPIVPVVKVTAATEAISKAQPGDQLLIIDGPARTSRGTLEIARHADLIVQPSGAGYDDLDPAIRLFHELADIGIPRERMVVALCRIGTDKEEDLARKYVTKAGYGVLPGSLPEKPLFREAHNRGLAVSEVAHKALKAEQILHSMKCRFFASTMSR